MANKLRGEVDFETDRGRFSLKYDVNALCELEDILDMGIPEFAEMFTGKHKVRLKYVRAAFWAGLRHHRPEISMRQAGEIMMEIGGMASAMDLIGKALNETFPKPDESEEGGASEGPQTGRGSRSHGGAGARQTSTQSNSGDSPPAKSN